MTAAARTAAALVRELAARDPETAARLARMLTEAPQGGGIRTPQDAISILVPHLAGHEVEHVAVIAVDRRLRVLDVARLSSGTDGAAIVDPRTILRWALTRPRSGAYGIVLAHNHPSGDPTPSREDIGVTAKLAQACAAVGILLLDHLVVVDDPYAGLRASSLVEMGHVPTQRTSYSFTA